MELRRGRRPVPRVPRARLRRRRHHLHRAAARHGLRGGVPGRRGGAAGRASRDIRVLFGKYNFRYSGAAAAATSACALRWPATTWTAPPTRGSAPTSRTASGRTSAGATWTPAAVGDNDGLMIVDNISGQNSFYSEASVKYEIYSCN